MRNMRVKLAILLFVPLLCAFDSAASLCAQEMTKDELASAYEKTFAKLWSWDITYASGHVSEWDGWKFSGQEQSRWRKSNNIERLDETKYNGGESVPTSAHYTDGSKKWWIYGDPGKAEGISLFDQKKLHAQINPKTNSALSVFPYSTFKFTLNIGDRIVGDVLYTSTYTVAQILKDFRTEIIDRQREGNATIITTRSYLPSANENPKHFIQISFDSSVGYNPRQIAYPSNTVFAPTIPVTDQLFYYVVNDFIEYHTSEDGVFFPVKISTGLIDDINKLGNHGITGKVAVTSITLNQPVDVPEIVFPPGIVVIVEDPEAEERLTSYIWGEDNKPLKVLTQADYDAAAEEYESRMNTLPKAQMSTTRIVLIVLGIIFIIAAFVLRALRWI
jgi:hypothetical protein